MDLIGIGFLLGAASVCALLIVVALLEAAQGEPEIRDLIKEHIKKAPLNELNTIERLVVHEIVKRERERREQTNALSVYDARTGETKYYGEKES